MKPPVEGEQTIPEWKEDSRKTYAEQQPEQAQAECSSVGSGNSLVYLEYRPL